MDEKDRKHIVMAHAVGKANPIGAAATALWLQNHILAQAELLKGHPAEARAHAEKRDRLTKAFEDDIHKHAAWGETTANTGTEVIATPVEAEVLRLIRDHGMVRNLSRQLPMTSKSHQIPSLDTDVTVAVIGEAATISDSMGTTFVSQKALTAKKIAGLVTISNEILQDNVIGLQDFVVTLLGEAIAEFEDKAALENSGSDYTGIAGASGVNAIDATTNGDAITLAKIMTAIFKAGKRDSRSNAAWFMSPLAADNVWGLVDSQGQPIFKFGAMPVAGVRTEQMVGPVPNGYLQGYPAFVHNGILTNRTKGTGTALTNIYFGNFSKLIFGDLLGIQFDVDPYGLFNSDSVRVRVKKRTAILVGVPSAFTIIKDIQTA
jgi:HK97 family phage major capsid protein